MFRRSAVATIGTVLTFAVGQTLPAQAAIIRYDFSNTDKTLVGNFSFDQAATKDQLVTVAEGLKIFASYGGKTYTEANDSLASVFTNLQGKIPPNQGLGLQFVVPDVFTVNAENFIDVATVQTVAYTAHSIPEPSAMLGLSIVGLGFLVAKKKHFAKKTKVS
ncbi:PEP-CTERM sorting domain-containing protein [Nostoc sp. FACHB-152]|uniref:PEP-CTERM sorting domain-containing protein n=1 Tax=unclassified Nostoc TaxID=2593658 RepID=UPI001687B4EE|nr:MULTISPECIES: PEP-CTERM sorting domain-containing protein [unclassified Nostoc]MBD2447198.1 PEP-CTERM sorting domain-containing protein [Nostoc sp. FACHB-152]MBD2471857.1 PEP-CTERM sorting domain-containing protein [Nostoc sp. FACHB-145]